MKKFLFIALSVVISFSAYSQEGWEMGGWLGASYYFGDLNTNYNLSTPGVAAGIIARYNFNKRLCLAFSGNYGNIKADDANSGNAFERARNLSFQSPVLDGTLQFEFNFMTYTHGSKDEFFTPYLYAGLSAFYFNPKTEYNGEMVELRPLGTEGQFKGEEYYTVQGAFAFGGGLKIDLNYEWSINLELAFRQARTDYLDDVSTIYPDPDDVEKLRGSMAADLSNRSISIPGVDTEAVSQPGHQRGDSNSNDSYAFVKVGIVYYFGDLKCPPYSR